MVAIDPPPIMRSAVACVVWVTFGYVRFGFRLLCVDQDGRHRSSAHHAQRGCLQGGCVTVGCFRLYCRDRGPAAAAHHLHALLLLLLLLLLLFASVCACVCVCGVGGPDGSNVRVRRGWTRGVGSTKAGAPERCGSTPCAQVLGDFGSTRHKGKAAEHTPAAHTRVQAHSHPSTPERCGSTPCAHTRTHRETGDTRTHSHTHTQGHSHTEVGTQPPVRT
jgi:hypothetical protein